MPRSGKPLSAARVQQVKEPGKYYDRNGLFLRVEPTGSKRWVQRLTIHGRQREIGLGSVELVSLAEAREKALEYRKVARSGGDPIAERRKTLAIPTFDEAVLKVHAIRAPTWRNEKHAAQFLSTLKEYVSPHFGDRPVSVITTSDVMAALVPIWTAKSETARRVRQRIGTVMKWAVAQGYRQDDPTQSVLPALPKAGQKKAHRKSIHYDDVAACLASVRASKAMEATKLAIEFLVLTGTRSGETRGATWDEIDLDKATWTIPAARMKMAETHVVPLSGRAVEVLREAEKIRSGDLVFPGSKMGKPLSDMTLSKLIKELGVDADVHGFRTSFRVWVQERTNTPFEVAEKALAHKTRNATTAAYARSDLFEKRRKLMEQWAAFLESRPGKVVSIGGSR